MGKAASKPRVAGGGRGDVLQPGWDDSLQVVERSAPPSARPPMPARRSTACGTCRLAPRSSTVIKLNIAAKRSVFTRGAMAPATDATAVAADMARDVPSF